MKIAELTIDNYRTIQSLSLGFPTFYTAICGKNDAGKTNVLRSLRTFFREQDPFQFYAREEMSIKEDFPKWLEKESKDKTILVGVTLHVQKESDEGLYLFLADYLSLEEKPDFLIVGLTTRLTTESVPREITVKVGEKQLEPLKSQEVLKRIQSSRCALFHDSTEYLHPFRFQQLAGLLSDVSDSDGEQLQTAKSRLDKTLGRIAKRNQKDLAELLGRLQEKYRIGLSAPELNIDEYPFSITLGNEKVDVPLESWGSGTQNRTRILMALFKAKRVSQAATSASKITPLIVIEEPESFLHPSAQAEFGSILRDMAEEFKVQVIVATHSPYFLSQTEPNANILLERAHIGRALRDTRRVDTTGSQWMEPFALALGLDNEQFKPWRDAIFSAKDSILLVEGETDKEYLTLLSDAEHGERRLQFDGEIFAYGGKDTLKQKQSLKFIRDRYKTFIVTYDLDGEADVEKHLQELGLRKHVEYLPIGRDTLGKQCIEGLLPDEVVQSVFRDNTEVVQKALGAKTKEQRSAKSNLKRLQLEEFKKVAKKGTDHYKEFYGLAKQLNKMIHRSN